MSRLADPENRIHLREVRVADIPTLFEWSCSPAGRTWRYRNGTPGFDQFVNELNFSVLTQLVGVRQSNGEPVCLVTAYDQSPARHAKIALLCSPSWRLSGLPMEALATFLTWLFEEYSLRKVFFEVFSGAIGPMRSALGAFCKVEGILEGFDVGANERLEDLHIFSLMKDAWMLDSTQQKVMSVLHSALTISNPAIVRKAQPAATL
jgi:RimJ/RimL family protein N-acetyltransferase